MFHLKKHDFVLSQIYETIYKRKYFKSRVYRLKEWFHSGKT
jgi:hypothetical protein